MLQYYHKGGFRMIKYISPHEIIKMEQFIREPVDLINKEIIENSSKRIILNGGRGSGKSVILHNTQDKGLGTENQTILIQFDSMTKFSNSPNELFDENFFNHYYELVFSWRLLSYVKDNYILTYESNFKDIETLLNDVSKNTDACINDMYYEKKELQRYLVPAEISAEILERFKKCTGINTLTLAIDRFDWTNGSSAYVQQIISKYFDLFDKTIITTDDLSLEDNSRQIELENKGYSFVTAMYGKNVDVIKHIIRKRIKLYNEITDNSRKSFDENIITDKIYSNLVSKANSNISLMINTFGEIADLLDWRDGRVENLEYEFDIETNNQLSKIRQLRKIDATPPKLHL